jgi:hypothetical protein
MRHRSQRGRAATWPKCAAIAPFRLPAEACRDQSATSPLSAAVSCENTWSDVQIQSVRLLQSL